MATRSLRPQHWFPRSAPQTLQYAVGLLYWNAALSFLFLLLTSGVHRFLPPLLILGDIAGGLGIANERKWGYFVAIAAAVIPLVLIWYLPPLGILGLLFQLTLVVLLLHPMSRSYFKIWFR